MTRAQKISLTIVGLIVLLIYLPLINAPFLGWDDDYNITRNPYFYLVPWWNIWLEPYLGLYVPFANTIWYALFKLGSGSPWPFRLFNLALHLGNTYLVFLLLRSLARKFDIKSDWAIGIGAAVFALHPLQVGAVAWISASKDLLSTFLGLSAVLLFFSEKKFSQIGALALFCFALLTKPQISVLPFAMFTYVFLFEKKKIKDISFHLVPWFLASAMVALLTYSVQQVGFEQSLALWQRPLVMLDSFGFYILKILWPLHLATDYGRQPEFLFQNPQQMILSILIAVAALVGGIYAIRGRSLWAFGIVWFILLLPVSGLISFGYQRISTVADHYNYLALAITGVLAMFLSSRFHTKPKVLVPILAVGLASWGWISFARTEVWSSQRNFSTDMVTQNPRSFSGLLSLGILDCVIGQNKEMGLHWLRKADEVRPNEPKVIGTLMTCNAQLGRHSEVLKYESRLYDPLFLARLKLDDSAISQFFMPLGVAHFETGNPEKGLRCFCMAALHQPKDPAIEMNIRMGIQRLGGNRSCPLAQPIEEFISSRY